MRYFHKIVTNIPNLLNVDAFLYCILYKCAAAEIRIARQEY